MASILLLCKVRLCYVVIPGLRKCEGLLWRGNKDKNAIKYLALINVSYFSAIYIMPSHIKYRTSFHYSQYADWTNAICRTSCDMLYLMRYAVPHAICRTSYDMSYLMQYAVPHAICHTLCDMQYLMRYAVPHAICRTSCNMPHSIWNKMI